MSTLEDLARKLGLPRPGFSPGQRSLAVTKRVGVLGALVCVVTGCTLGLVNLLFVDTERSSPSPQATVRQCAAFATLVLLARSSPRPW